MRTQKQRLRIHRGKGSREPLVPVIASKSLKRKYLEGEIQNKLNLRRTKSRNC